MASPSPRVLTVQSHVVRGYCGNKSATFPLQLLEFEVDVINTVQFSNHGYKKRGQIFTSKDLEDIHTGLKENNLLNYDFVISGYVADVSYIVSLDDLIRSIKQERKKRNLDCCYTFDPVLGDDGVGFFVPGAEIVAEAFKKHLLPLADIITPNRFEASVLTGIAIDDSSGDILDQAYAAIKSLHKMGIRTVVMTSLECKNEPDEIICIVSHQHPPGYIHAAYDTHESWIIRVPKLKCTFTGTGDMFAALFTGWLHKTGFNIKRSLECTSNTIHEILKDTLKFHVNSPDEPHELRIVQNKDSIIRPKLELVAERIQL